MTYLKSLNGLLMLFNLDPSEPAQEVLFSRKKKTQSHPEISLNNIPVERSSYQKHLGLILDEKLNFKQHIDNAISKINKGIAVIKKLRYSLPRKSLITIYKAFLRPLIDYGDIIYDQPQNESFREKLESVQYKVALAITGAIKGSSPYNYNFSSSQVYPYLTFGRIFSLYITKSPIPGEFRNKLNITKSLEL